MMLSSCGSDLSNGSATDLPDDKSSSSTTDDDDVEVGSYAFTISGVAQAGPMDGVVNFYAMKVTGSGPKRANYNEQTGELTVPENPDDLVPVETTTTDEDGSYEVNWRSNYRCGAVMSVVPAGAGYDSETTGNVMKTTGETRAIIPSLCGVDEGSEHVLAITPLSEMVSAQFEGFPDEGVRGSIMPNMDYEEFFDAQVNDVGRMFDFDEGEFDLSILPCNPEAGNVDDNCKNGPRAKLTLVAAAIDGIAQDSGVSHDDIVKVVSKDIFTGASGDLSGESVFADVEFEENETFFDLLNDNVIQYVADSDNRPTWMEGEVLDGFEDMAEDIGDIDIASFEPSVQDMDTYHHELNYHNSLTYKPTWDAFNGEIYNKLENQTDEDFYDPSYDPCAGGVEDQEFCFANTFNGEDFYNMEEEGTLEDAASVVIENYVTNYDGFSAGMIYLEAKLETDDSEDNEGGYNYMEGSAFMKHESVENKRDEAQEIFKYFPEGAQEFMDENVGDNGFAHEFVDNWTPEGDAFSGGDFTDFMSTMGNYHDFKDMVEETMHDEEMGGDTNLAMEKAFATIKEFGGGAELAGMVNGELFGAMGDTFGAIAQFGGVEQFQEEFAGDGVEFTAAHMGEFKTHFGFESADDMSSANENMEEFGGYNIINDLYEGIENNDDGAVMDFGELMFSIEFAGGGIEFKADFAEDEGGGNFSFKADAFSEHWNFDSFAEMDFGKVEKYSSGFDNMGKMDEFIEDNYGEDVDGKQNMFDTWEFYGGSDTFAEKYINDEGEYNENAFAGDFGFSSGAEINFNTISKHQTGFENIGTMNNFFGEFEEGDRGEVFGMIDMYDDTASFLMEHADVDGNFDKDDFEIHWGGAEEGQELNFGKVQSYVDAVGGKAVFESLSNDFGNMETLFGAMDNYGGDGVHDGAENFFNEFTIGDGEDAVFDSDQYFTQYDLLKGDVDSIHGFNDMADAMGGVENFDEMLENEFDGEMTNFDNIYGDHSEFTEFAHQQGGHEGVGDFMEGFEGEDGFMTAAGGEGSWDDFIGGYEGSCSMTNEAGNYCVSFFDSTLEFAESACNENFSEEGYTWSDSSCAHSASVATCHVAEYSYDLHLSGENMTCEIAEQVCNDYGGSSYCHESEGGDSEVTGSCTTAAAEDNFQCVHFSGSSYTTEVAEQTCNENFAVDDNGTPDNSEDDSATNYLWSNASCDSAPEDYSCTVVNVDDNGTADNSSDDSNHSYTIFYSASWTCEGAKEMCDLYGEAMDGSYFSSTCGSSGEGTDATVYLSCQGMLGDVKTLCYEYPNKTITDDVCAELNGTDIYTRQESACDQDDANLLYSASRDLSPMGAGMTPENLTRYSYMISADNSCSTHEAVEGGTNEYQIIDFKPKNCTSNCDGVLDQGACEAIVGSTGTDAEYSCAWNLDNDICEYDTIYSD